MWGLCFVLLFISAASAEDTKLTLTKIYPCLDTITDTVSRFKTDVFAIYPSLRYCDVPMSTNVTVSRETSLQNRGVLIASSYMYFFLTVCQSSHC